MTWTGTGILTVCWEVGEDEVKAGLEESWRPFRSLDLGQRTHRNAFASSYSRIETLFHEDEDCSYMMCAGAFHGRE